MSLNSVAVIGAHCDDIAIGAGATLMEIVRDNPGVVVHALVLTGGGTEREVEEKNAFAAICPTTDVRLTVADLPHGQLPDHWRAVQQCIAEFRHECEPDLVFGPQRHDCHQDHRLVAELIPTEFRDHLVLGYEVLKWESDLLNPTVREAGRVELSRGALPSPARRPWMFHCRRRRARRASSGSRVLAGGSCSRTGTSMSAWLRKERCSEIHAH